MTSVKMDDVVKEIGNATVHLEVDKDDLIIRVQYLPGFAEDIKRVLEAQQDLSGLFDDMHIIRDGWYTSNRYMYPEAEMQIMTAKETLKVYTQEEFNAACKESYDRGREDGYDSALNDAYLNL